MRELNSSDPKEKAAILINRKAILDALAVLGQAQVDQIYNHLLKINQEKTQRLYEQGMISGNEKKKFIKENTMSKRTIHRHLDVLRKSGFVEISNHKYCFQDTDNNSTEPAKIQTWSDRLIDRDNYWLNAVNLEDDGNLFDAVMFYLRDAEACLKERSLVKTALSCSCAATCLARSGNPGHANSLFREAASLYEENAGSVISESIRESLWSLEEAYEYYFVADEFERAQIVYDKYMTLATKISPLFGLEERKETLEFRKLNAQALKFNDRSLPSRQITSEVIGAVEQLLELRKSTHKDDRDLRTYTEITYPKFNYHS